MRKSLLPLVMLLGVLLLVGCNPKPAKVYSPDKKICVVVDDSTLTASYEGQVVQTVRIGACRWTDCHHVRKTLVDNYTMVSGKRRECHNKFNVMSCTDSDLRNLVVRVSNDGVAFSFSGGDESVSFVIPDGTKRWLQRQKTDLVHCRYQRYK